MNAKARKKEKRRSEREALQTTTTKEDEALDATLLFDIEPELPPEDEEDSATDDDADEAVHYMTEMLPTTFAVALAMRLEKAGHGGPTPMELKTLERIMEYHILPSMEPYILAMRRQEAEGAVVERVSLQLGCTIYTDKDYEKTGDDKATQEAPQQQPAGALQGSQDDPVRAQQDTAEGAPDEAQSTLWDLALVKAQSEGGSEEEIKARAGKILRKKKQRLREKSKVKKQAVIAA